MLRVRTEDLRLGMFVQSLEGSWFNHPFWKTKFLLTEGDDLRALQSSDVDAVSALVGKLQDKLLLRSIAFSVSTDTRRKTEDALIGDALAAFQERAKKIAGGLGARDYQIVSVSIQTPGGGGPVPMYARAEVADFKVAAPSFESGQSTLQVRVDATIELER